MRGTYCEVRNKSRALGNVKDASFVCDHHRDRNIARDKILRDNSVFWNDNDFEDVV